MGLLFDRPQLLKLFIIGEHKPHDAHVNLMEETAAMAAVQLFSRPIAR
jgi:hypothetical protein